MAARGRITAYARIGLSLESRITPEKRAWLRNPHGRFVAATDFCPLYPFPETGPPLPSIAHADADDRDLATHRDLDNMPKTCHLRAHSDAHGQLDLTLALKKTPAAAKSFSKVRSPTSIKDVGAIPADPITNFRPLFLFPLQQTLPALYQTASPAVLSQ